jgi:hypothetical protein
MAEVFALGPQGVTLAPTTSVSTLPMATTSGNQVLVKNEGTTICAGDDMPHKATVCRWLAVNAIATGRGG